MKRFYKTVTKTLGTEGYSILLDGKPIKTRLGYVLTTPHESIVQALILEWEKQGDKILPDTMPLTQILNTKLDRVTKDRVAMTQTVLNFLDTDLLCYLAEIPEDLVCEQEAAWAPWRVWFFNQSKISLETTQGLHALKQDSRAHSFLAQAVSDLNLDEFTILQSVTALSGSVVLALAFVQGAATAEDIFQACFVEETYKDRLYDAEKYGPDPMLEKKRTAMMCDLEAAGFYIRTLRALKT